MHIAHTITDQKRLARYFILNEFFPLFFLCIASLLMIYCFSFIIRNPVAGKYFIFYGVLILSSFSNLNTGSSTCGTKSVDFWLIEKIIVIFTGPFANLLRINQNIFEYAYDQEEIKKEFCFNG
jgi:hypothetical protein